MRFRANGFGVGCADLGGRTGRDETSAAAEFLIGQINRCGQNFGVGNDDTIGALGRYAGCAVTAAFTGVRTLSKTGGGHLITDGEIRGGADGVANLAVTAFSPETKGLLLIGQLRSTAAVEVVRHDSARGGAIEVFGASFGGQQQALVATVLGDLNVPASGGGGRSTQIEVEDVTGVRSIDVHVFSGVGTTDGRRRVTARVGNTERIRQTLSS